MANKIQIKRSATTATPVSLSAGELAYSNAVGGSGVLYIGSTDGGTVVPIAGVRTPGTLTANQAMVVNATSGIDKIIVANLQPTSIYAGGSLGSDQDILSVNATGGVYWRSAGSLAINTAATYAWSNTHTFSAAVTVQNTGSLTIGNTTVNTAIVRDSITINGTSVVVNTSTLNSSGFIANSTGAYVTGTVNAASHTVGTSFVANATGVYHTGVVNAAAHTVGTSFIANTTQVTISGIPLSANGSVGTAGHALYSNGATGSPYWSTTVTSVASGNGLTGGPITTTGTISIVANNGIVANSTGVFVNPGPTLTVNTTGVHVNSTLTLSSLNVSGDLTVSGTVTTINTTSLSVKDNMIILADQLASTATFLDNVDTGFFVKTGNTSSNYYAGIARVASLSSNTNPYFKLFSTTAVVNNTIIDTTATTGTLQAFIAPWGAGGALVANGTNVTITANSTVAVAITANTLALSTPLPTTSGGTGLNTYTAGDLIVGGAGNSLTKLAVGTDGYVLQVSGTSVTWNSIDGGTF